MTESPYVRSGAVVRCAACEHKYRIKSSHVERVLTTGPRTLDEAGSVLRGDSVDIDPDELAPVKIDDEGNVVGLSGLSELMRQSDAQGAKAKLQSRIDDDPPDGEAAPPAAIVRGAQQSTAGKTSTAQERARALSRKRKMRTNAIVIAALTCLLIVSGVVLIMMSTGGDQTPDNPDTTAAATPGGSAGPGDASVDLFPGSGGPGDADNNPGGPADTTDDGPFAGVGPPSPNPDSAYQPKTPQDDPAARPVDVPTVLIPATPIRHEGWYVMTPPRGAADAGGDSDVELDDLTPSALADGRTLLTGTITNRAGRAVLGGEAHVVLLDSAGRVFAETYLPVALVDAGAAQSVSLAIPTRYWQRARGVRSSVEVKSWLDALRPMPGVEVEPVGAGPHTALRVSARHTGGEALRGLLLLIEAQDTAGRLHQRFAIDEPSLYLEPGGWLDLMVATPVADDAGPLRWSAQVQPR